MKHINSNDIEAIEIKSQNSQGFSVRVLISGKDGALNFSMRLFSLEPNGYTPFHKHPWEHEIYCLKGKLELLLENDEKVIINKGDAVYLKPEEWHSFKNISQEEAEFLCIVPKGVDLFS